MSKALNLFALMIAISAPAFQSYAAAAPSQISFGIDCMIHDDHGQMLSDLGMLGQMMGSYTARQSFTYKTLQVAADLNGPFAEASEVASPQLKLTVTDASGAVLAKVVTTANPDLNTALFIPVENAYLHCTKMDM
jgi:hypothetical protein